MDPESGFKPYSRFYQYTYVAILRDLYAAQAAQTQQSAAQNQRSATQAQAVPVEDVTFEPIRPVRPFQAWRSQLTFGFEKGRRSGRPCRPRHHSRSLHSQTITPLSCSQRYSAGSISITPLSTPLSTPRRYPAEPVFRPLARAA
jgi:hypothetical protein